MELQILDKIENESGKNQKQLILESQLGNVRFAQLLQYGYSFYKKFNIKKFNMPPAINSNSDLHSNFIQLLDALNNRSITGNLALQTVETFFGQCNELQQKWYQRILQKDFRMGVSVNTANKVGFNIPKFDCMLATDSNKCKKLDSIINKGVLVSPKLDGYRCIAIWDGVKVVLYSRNGSEYVNFPQIEEALNLALNPNEPVILDGEIMSDDFNSMQKSAFASTRGTTVGNVKYHVFDRINYDEWLCQDFKVTKLKRYEQLSDMFSQGKEFAQSETIRLVPQMLMSDLKMIEGIAKAYETSGYEGAMLISKHEPYYLGRKTNKLLKIKTMQTQDCIVKGTVEGNNKYEKMLGSLVVEQENGKICEVGTGFTDEMRQEFWDNKIELQERICEVKYQELTPDGIMRFPVFLRWRDNGAGEGKR